MSAGNTPERLKAFTLYAHPELRTDRDELIATLQPGRETVAHRLAACWNACEGIETYALELMTGDRSINQQITSTHRLGARPATRKTVEYRRQRDTLRSALIVAREFISTDRNSFADAAMPPDGRPMEPTDAAELADYDAALLQINEAIEKAGAA